MNNDSKLFDAFYEVAVDVSGLLTLGDMYIGGDDDDSQTAGNQLPKSEDVFIDDVLNALDEMMLTPSQYISEDTIEYIDEVLGSVERLIQVINNGSPISNKVVEIAEDFVMRTEAYLGE